MKPIPLSRSVTTRSLQILLAVIFGVAAVGMVDSILIHLKEIAAKTDASAFASCSTEGIINCSKVADSKYSQFLGFPVSLFGVMFYQTMALLSAGLLLGFKPAPWVRTAISLLVLGAFAFSLRLLYFSYFAIGYLCPYCLVSNVTTLLVTIFWFIYVKKSSR